MPVSTATGPVAKSAAGATGGAMTESVSGRFEEAARKAQQRINQRDQEKRTIAGDDVTHS